MAQSVKQLTSAQVMISQFMDSSPALGSVLTAQSLEPASDSVTPSLCPFPARSLSLFLAKINKYLTNKERRAGSCLSLPRGHQTCCPVGEAFKTGMMAGNSYLTDGGGQEHWQPPVSGARGSTEQPSEHHP